MLAADPISFQLPPELEASEPPEARGLRRDQVRLLASYRSDDRLLHTRFEALPELLEAGDLVVINTSATLNAALAALRSDGEQYELHLSTHLPADLWIVELRQLTPEGSAAFFDAQAGEVFELPAGGKVQLLAPYSLDRNRRDTQPKRLWLATLELPEALLCYLERYGFPIRYRYVKEKWPLDYYQTVYATEPGSAEMPSAGRPFTHELITRLVSQGIQIAPLILHTGVASLESHEAPYEEFYRVPLVTAQAVNQAHASGRRVIAVGTTVVRALESVVDNQGLVHPGEGWTRLVIKAERKLRAVDGLLTGMHEPQASHLDMLAALASHQHLAKAYTAALEEGYLWHEFGDLHLILP